MNQIEMTRRRRSAATLFGRRGRSEATVLGDALRSDDRAGTPLSGCFALVSEFRFRPPRADE